MATITLRSCSLLLSLSLAAAAHAEEPANAEHCEPSERPIFHPWLRSVLAV